ncbi:regulatory protein SipA [Crocosphaera sp. Alani8]|uniref:regulatory protein SipA n=1 Tax=Crocosphaera sp. Alani8 TaxID=3038952 RepID=UPI00313AC997
MNEQQIAVGSKVSLVSKPPYLKTADPMPMLRPSDILDVGDEGMVVDRRPGGYWGVKFAQGMFLVESQYIAVIAPPESSHKDV